MAGDIFLYRLARDVVRRGKCADVERALIPNKAMAVAYAGVKLELFGIEMLSQKLYQYARFFGGNIVGAVIENGLVLVIFLIGEGNEIAAERNISRLHINADRPCLQRRAARVVDSGVVAEYREVSDVRAGFQPIGNALYQTNGSFFSQLIHSRLISGLHRAFSAQLFNGVISHTVAEHYNVFCHKYLPFKSIIKNFINIITQFRQDFNTC